MPAVRMTTQSLLVAEPTSFVSGSRPSAPIKTAIIRPTNFYDGPSRSSFGASPDNKLKAYPRSDHIVSPISCAPDMPPLTPGADSDPLSDNCAVMYGTNATRRRRSKVEAWIESSSSAQSEESLSENRGLPRPLGRRRTMQLSSASSTLSKEEVDLSFENLCQELLALSASCSTLERIICKTESEISSCSHPEKTFTFDNNEPSTRNVKQQQPVRCYKQSSGPDSLTKRASNNGDTGSNLDSSSAHGGMSGSSLRQEMAATSSYRHHGYTTNNSVLTNLTSTNVSSQQIILPASKMQALTIDVGVSHRSQRKVVGMPIRDSLVTVISPQSMLAGSAADKLTRVAPQERTVTKSAGVSHTAKSTRVATSAACSDVSSQQSSVYSSVFSSVPMKYDKHRDREAPLVMTDRAAAAVTDHVAAAITTQTVNSTQTRMQTPSSAPKFHRSVSEPASFVTLIPDKRSSLVRSPSKKDFKGRQLLRVGMDFIRRNEKSTLEEQEPPTNYSAKDNLLMNNLDICNLSKSTIANPDKMVLSYSCQMNGARPKPHQPQRGKTSLGSDSVFEETVTDDTAMLIGHSVMPNFSSTCKSSQPAASESSSGNSRQNTTVQDRSIKTATESLSSSFESEAQDILASLKSANALKAQFRHGKFPTDVDPVTGSPRQPTRTANEDKLRLLEGLTYNRQHSHPGSNKSSCLNSPNGSTATVLAHQHPLVVHRSPQSQASSNRRSRQSHYDNVLQSPFGGLRMSVASGSSSGTVFSRPWGDLPRWEDYQHNEEFRHRLGSAVSSQGRSAENGIGSILSSPHRHQSHHTQHSHFRFSDRDSSRSPSYSRSISEEREIHPHHNLSSIPKFPVCGLPDVAVEADMNTPPHKREKSTWETTLDRALNRVRTFTKLLHTRDGHSCEITRYTQMLLSDSHSLPGTLIGRFHTCTWETNSLDRNHSNNNNNRSPRKSCLRKSTSLKRDWYSNNIQSSWAFDRNGKPVPQTDALAYANGGYLLNTCSKEAGRTGEVVSSLGAKEHIVLSNVRQFVDGMKRYLLNQPDTQMMFAIQRERIKKTLQMGNDQFINLDAIMEAVLEKVILQPLSDHLLNVITTHADYSIREITQIESGMKVIFNNREELFSSMRSVLSEIDMYDQTLRSVFQSMKSEFSPISKLQYLLQIALLFILIHNRQPSNREQDLLLMFVYAMARYGDATLVVHLAYIRHLIPSSIKSGATAFVLGLYENTVQVYSRIVKVPGTLARRTMILNEILEKLSCYLMIADESTNRVIRRKLSLSRWSTTSELIDIIQVDLANHELSDFKLYLATDEKEILLRPSENVSELLMAHGSADSVCALVYRRTNTQMLLPPP